MPAGVQPGTKNPGAKKKHPIHREEIQPGGSTRATRTNFQQSPGRQSPARASTTLVNQVHLQQKQAAGAIPTGLSLKRGTPGAKSQPLAPGNRPKAVKGITSAREANLPPAIRSPAHTDDRGPRMNKNSGTKIAGRKASPGATPSRQRRPE